MSIQTACPNCEKAYKLADAMVGKQVRCKSCGDPFFVEDPNAEEPEEREEDRPRQRSTTPSRDDRDDRDDEDDRPARKSRRREDEDEEDDAPRPRKKRKQKSNLGLVIGLAAGGGALLLVGIIVTVVLLLGSSKFTVENFNKVQAGMSEREVIDLLGAPTQTVDAGAMGIATKSLIWRNRHGEFVVTLMNGQVFAAIGVEGQGNGGLNLGGNDFPRNMGGAPNMGGNPRPGGNVNHGGGGHGGRHR